MISNLVVKQTYTGNGTARNWPIPFSYTDTSQVKVKLTVNGAETLVPSTDYTVDTVAQNVVYPKTADPIPATTKITLYRETAKTQATALTNQGALYPETLEASFDKLTEIVQEQAEQIGRTVKTQISSSTSPDELMAELTAGAAAAVAAAGAAATSETNAAGSATAAANSATAASASQTAAAASQTAAATSETNAGASATAAANSAASALASQTAAAASETNAAISAAAALASKTAAATSETNAAASQTAAAGSQVAAANSAAAAQASADTANAYAGAVNCILRGLKISAVNGFSVGVDSGAVLANEVRKAVAAGSVTMSARKAALIYADNTGALGKVDAKYPTDYIDNNTIGMWIFNKSGNIPNSAFGLSSSAVANALVPTGGVSIVDGHADYAAKGNGSTGYYASSNYTNFPMGAAEREMLICFTSNSSAVDRILAAYGGDANNNVVGLRVANRRLKSPTTDVDLSYDTDAGMVQLATICYDGSTTTLKINGVKVYSVAQTLATTAGLLYVCRYLTASMFSPDTIHFIELRNKIRPDAVTAAIANKLMLPNFYTKSSGVYPTIPAAYATTYHEYRFTEASGTTVVDSNTSAALNGTATGTTITSNEVISGGYARKFSATTDKVSLGTFACGSVFSFAAVLNVTAYQSMLWGNRPSGGASGILLWVNASGYIELLNGLTRYTLTNTTVKLGRAVFVGIFINGTTAKVYIDAPNNPVSVVTIGTLNTTANAAFLGYDAGSSATINHITMDYCLFGNFELTQADMQQLYNSLMATGRRSIIDDVLPADSVSLGFIRTSSTAIIEYNDADYKYGRREKAVGGNRRVFLGFKAFSLSAPLLWETPFGNAKVKYTVVYAQDGKGTNEIAVAPYHYVATGVAYGVLFGGDSLGKIRIVPGPTAVAILNGAWQTSGYLGVYAEVMEDFKGVDAT